MFDQLVSKASAVHGQVKKTGMVPQARWDRAQFSVLPFQMWMLQELVRSSPLLAPVPANAGDDGGAMGAAAQAAGAGGGQRGLQAARLLPQLSALAGGASMRWLTEGPAGQGRQGAAQAGAAQQGPDVPQPFRCSVVINHEYKFIFVRTLKAASTAVFSAFNGLCMSGEGWGDTLV